jgi:hypothetical protein
MGHILIQAYNQLIQGEFQQLLWALFVLFFCKHKLLSIESCQYSRPRVKVKQGKQLLNGLVLYARAYHIQIAETF